MAAARASNTSRSSAARDLASASAARSSRAVGEAPCLRIIFTRAREPVGCVARPLCLGAPAVGIGTPVVGVGPRLLRSGCRVLLPRAGLVERGLGQGEVALLLLAQRLELSLGCGQRSLGLVARSGFCLLGLAGRGSVDLELPLHGGGGLLGLRACRGDRAELLNQPCQPSCHMVALVGECSDLLLEL